MSQTSIPPLLFSRLFPLPDLRTGFGKRGLCVLDSDDAVFAAPSLSAPPPPPTTLSSSSTSTSGSSSGSLSSSGYETTFTFPLKEETSTRTDDCFVSFSRSQSASSSSSSMESKLHYLRPSDQPHKWKSCSSVPSNNFALGSIEALRGEDYPVYLDLLTCNSRYKSSVVRQWLCNDGKKIALQVDCVLPVAPSPQQKEKEQKEQKEKEEVEQEEEEEEGANKKKEKQTTIISFLLFFDSFMQNAHEGCGWYLSALCKLPLPQLASLNRSSSSSSSSSSPCTRVGGEASIMGGFLTSNIFLYGWEDHCINFYFNGKNSVRAQVCRHTLPFEQQDEEENEEQKKKKKKKQEEEAAAQQQQTKKQIEEQEEKEAAASYLRNIPLSSWLVTAASASDSAASNVFFCLVNNVRTGVCTKRADFSVTGPAFIHFRVRSSANITSLLRYPRHNAVTDSFFDPLISQSNLNRTLQQKAKERAVIGGPGHSGTVVLPLPPQVAAGNHFLKNIEPPTAVVSSKRIERIFSSQLAASEVALAANPSSSSSSSGNNSSSSSANASAASAASGYTLIWERTGVDSVKLHLFQGKKTFFVSREKIIQGNGGGGVGNNVSAASVTSVPRGGGDFEGVGSGGGGGSGDCLVDMFRWGPQRVVAMSLVEEQKVRACYFSDCKLSVIEIHFSVSGFFARRELPPQPLYSVVLPESFSRAVIEVNNSSSCSFGILTDGISSVSVQLPEKV